MKSVHLTIFAAVGVLCAGSPSFAGDRHAYRQYTPASGTYTPRNSTASVSYEQKCMILPCGSRWCYKVRR